MSSQKFKTYIINFISGPGSGKTTMSALTFVRLKQAGYVVEYVQEYAKSLVWTGNFDILNNQYLVTKKQYELLKKINGNVQFIVTDGPLINGLYYNRHNKDNTSNIDKTEQLILQTFSEFNNINIFLERGDFKYEKEGRLQTSEEAAEIDVILKHMLKQNHVEYESFKSDEKLMYAIMNHIFLEAGMEREPEDY